MPGVLPSPTGRLSRKLPSWVYLVLVVAAASTLVAIVAVSLAKSPSGNETPSWSTGLSEWHIDAEAPRRLLVVIRQLGTPLDQADDTRQVDLVDSNGNTQHTRSSAWTPIDLSPWLPKEARVARLSYKAVITKGPEEGLATVYGMARSVGARSCGGPPGFERYPVDFSFAGSVAHPAIAAQAVLTRPLDGVRSFGTVDVVLKDRRFEFAWGYRKMNADAVAIGVYLEAWAR